MASRTEPSDIQLDERQARHGEAEKDEEVRISLESFPVDTYLVAYAMKELEGIFPPKSFKAIKVKDFQKRCSMTRIEEDNQGLDDFLARGGFELIDVLGDGNCGYYSTIVGLVLQRSLPLKSIQSNARLQASMLLLRKYLRDFMEREADNLLEAICRDSPDREMVTFAVELDNESRSAKLSGIWHDSISIETYCMYLRYDDEAFLSPFAMVAIAASFKIAVVVHNARKVGDQVQVDTAVYDGTRYDIGVMKTDFCDFYTSAREFYPRRIEMVLFDNHFMFLRSKNIPGNKSLGDGILKKKMREVASNLTQPLSPGLNETTRKSSPIPLDNKGPTRSSTVRMSSVIPEEVTLRPIGDPEISPEGAGTLEKKRQLEAKGNSVPLPGMNVEIDRKLSPIPPSNQDVSRNPESAETTRKSFPISLDNQGLSRSPAESSLSSDTPDGVTRRLHDDSGLNQTRAGTSKKKRPFEESGNSVQPLLPGTNVEIDRTPSPISVTIQGLPKTSVPESLGNLDGAPGRVEGSRFSDDPLLLKIREIRADPTLRMKAKKNSIVSFLGNLQTKEARTRSETSKNPSLNTQLFNTVGFWFDEKNGIFKRGKVAATDLTSYGEYFLEVVKALGPIRMNAQPVMAASVYGVPMRLRTEVPMRLPAEGCRLCLAYSVAGALEYMGKPEAARLAREASFKWCNSPPDVAIALMEKLFAQFIPEVARPVVYGRYKTGRKTVQVTLEHIFEQSDGWLWVVFPTSNDNANHSFCAIDNLVFDTAAPKALRRSKVTADFLYGDAVTHVHARHYKYPLTKNRKRRRKKKSAKWAFRWVPEESYDLL